MPVIRHFSQLISLSSISEHIARHFSSVVKSRDCVTGLPELRIWLHYSLAEWHMANHLIFLYLSFLVYKIEIIIIPAVYDYYRV